MSLFAPCQTRQAYQELESIAERLQIEKKPASYEAPTRGEAPARGKPITCEHVRAYQLACRIDALCKAAQAEVLEWDHVRRRVAKLGEVYGEFGGLSGLLPRAEGARQLKSESAPNGCSVDGHVLNGKEADRKEADREAANREAAGGGQDKQGHWTQGMADAWHDLFYFAESSAGESPMEKSSLEEPSLDGSPVEGGEVKGA